MVQVEGSDRVIASQRRDEAIAEQTLMLNEPRPNTYISAIAFCIFCGASLAQQIGVRIVRPAIDSLLAAAKIPSHQGQSLGLLHSDGGTAIPDLVKWRKDLCICNLSS